MNMKKVFLIVLCVASLACLGCGKQKQKQAGRGAGQKPAVTVIKVEEKVMDHTFAYAARAESIQKMDIVARIDGFLKERYFTEGANVKAGQRLFLIEQDQYQANVMEARANLQQAEATAYNTGLQLKRGVELLKNMNISQATVDDRRAQDQAAKAQVMQAKAALRKAELDLGYTDVRAPVSGKASYVKYNPGDYISGVSAGPLVTLVTQDPMYVSFFLTNQELHDLENEALTEGHSLNSVGVKLQLDGKRFYPYDGKINFLDVIVNQKTDTIKVRAEFPNKNGIIMDGQFGNIVLTKKESKKYPTIPIGAMQVDQKGRYVLLVDKDNKVSIRQIKVGAQTDREFSVLEGLKAGDLIIIDGIQKVQPGIEVDAQLSGAKASADKKPASGTAFPAMQYDSKSDSGVQGNLNAPKSADDDAPVSLTPPAASEKGPKTAAPSKAPVPVSAPKAPAPAPSKK